MPTRIFTAAVVAAMALLLPIRAQAQVAQPGVSDTAYLVVDRLLMHRGALALTKDQVKSLTALSRRLRTDGRRRRLVDFDRVPGKSVPRYTHAPTAGETRRLALHPLSPEQRQEAALLLDGQAATDTVTR
ncbi:MAG: hypothetical protein ABIY46_03525 [Gemmatimonadales bacterium]